MPYDTLSSIDIPWDMFDVIVGGASAIDVPRLYMESLDEAEDFLAAYGYRWSDPEERAEAHDLLDEALEFIVEDLLHDEPELSVAPEVLAERDVRKLLLWASTDPKGERQLWSCAVLRVMHTFAHCGSYFQKMFSEQIREQIVERFQPHVVEGPRGLMLGTGATAIPLADFQVRATKSRKSLALKLLQKAENVAADVFDWVGLRFVTKERFDALLVLKYLRANSLIVFAHVRPGRSRNTLIDMGRVKRDMGRVNDEIRAGRLAEHERWEKMRELARRYPYPSPATKSYNPFSASSYHSIQFTCSQQVRVPNPYIGRGVSRVLQRIERGGAPRVSEGMARRLTRAGVGSDVHFFFPYEVQVLDHSSFEASRSGRASHDVYKNKQRLAVKRRLFGDKIEQSTDRFAAVKGPDAESA